MTPGNMEHQAEVYDQELAHIANRLRALALDVERRGAARMDLARLVEQRVKSAMEVQHTLLHGMAQIGLGRLIEAAVAADHATAAMTPAQLLDRAATGIASVDFAKDDKEHGHLAFSDGVRVELAEAALRGAQVLL